MPPTFTIGSGGGSDIEDGVYPVTLVSISDPKVVHAERGPNAGQDIELMDWTFAIDEGQYEGTEIQVSTSMASGPKSKMFGFLTALMGGKAPGRGDQFKATDLYGRRALATIRKNEDGWARIQNLGAMPPAMLGQRFAAATGAPTSEPVAAAAPLREQVAAASAPGTEPKLPF